MYIDKIDKVSNFISDEACILLVVFFAFTPRFVVRMSHTVYQYEIQFVNLQTNSECHTYTYSVHTNDDFCVKNHKMNSS